MNNINLKHIIIAISIIIMLIPTLQIRKLEQNWRNGTAQFICNEESCFVKTYGKNGINTKEVNLEEIVSFNVIVDKTRARNNYAAYVIMAKKENDETFDFFEVDTFYEDDYEKALNSLNGALQRKSNIKINYPESRTKKRRW